MEINIAICDDDKNYINEIIQYLNNCSWKRNNSFVYHTFYCGEALLESKQYFDFIILDIEMDKVSGIEVKEIFYNRNNQSRIIFLTNYEEYMSDSFEKNVYGYISKDVLHKMDIPLNKIFKELLEHRLIKISEDIIDLYEVYYVKADGPYINIHTNGSYEVYRMTLKDFANKIHNSNFIRIHKSYLINMRYINEINNKFLILDNDERLPISKSNRKTVLITYRKYLLENIIYD